MSAAFVDGDPDDPAPGADPDAAGRGEPRVPRAVGTLAEEMSLLASALEATRRDPEGAARGVGGRGQPCPSCGSAGPPSCTWCPLCRGVGLVRTLGPETLRSLADVTGLLSDGLRRVAGWLTEEAPTPAGGSGHGGEPGPGRGGGGQGPGPTPRGEGGEGEA